ncbi:hypothetical protein GQ457_13G000390 [Hibiscus cannabinus]
MMICSHFSYNIPVAGEASQHHSFRQVSDGPDIHIRKVMGVDDNSESKLKPSVVLTGTAKESCGPCIGLVDIGVSESAFLFRVSLPSQLKCEIQRDGKVRIQGVITQGTGMLEGISSKCEMVVEKFCRPGPFTISFNLPGPVDPRLFSPKFRHDGILEVVVMKSMNPGDSVDARAPPS